MSTLVETLAHESEARALLISQFKGTTTLQLLLDSWVEQVQLLETALFDLLADRAINVAVGLQLDNLGTVVNETRQGRNDTDYRLALLTRIRINLSSGTAEQLLVIMQAIVGVSLEYDEQAPAGFVLRATAPLAAGIGPSAGTVLRSARPAGVKGILEFTEHSFATTFTLGDVAGFATPDAARGFDSTSGTTGGYFAGATEG